MADGTDRTSLVARNAALAAQLLPPDSEALASDSLAKIAALENTDATTSGDQRRVVFAYRTRLKSIPSRSLIQEFESPRIVAFTVKPAEHYRLRQPTVRRSRPADGAIAIDLREFLVEGLLVNRNVSAATLLPLMFPTVIYDPLGLRETFERLVRDARHAWRARCARYLLGDEQASSVYLREGLSSAFSVNARRLWEMYLLATLHRGRWLRPTEARELLATGAVDLSCMDPSSTQATPTEADVVAHSWAPTTGLVVEKLRLFDRFVPPGAITLDTLRNDSRALLASAVSLTCFPSRLETTVTEDFSL